MGIDFSEIENIARWNQDTWSGSIKCFRKTLNHWLDKNNDATWKSIEVALTNVNRLKLKLNPVDDVYAVHTDDVSATSSECYRILEC